MKMSSSKFALKWMRSCHLAHCLGGNSNSWKVIYRSFERVLILEWKSSLSSFSWACWFLLPVLVLQQLLFLGVFRSTHYTFEPETLLCRSLIFKRRIPYASIRKIEQHTSLYAGLKMSASFRGIIIHYNTYDELFISPAESDRFIALLKERNPGIVVI